MADPLEGRTGVHKGRSVVRRGGRWVYTDDKLTQDQGQAQGYAKLMGDAESRYYDAVRKGYNPTTPGNTLAAVVEGLPLGGLDGLGAVIRDDASDLGRQAELQWSDAQLKAMSGAAAPEAEVKRNVKTFFPRPGENPFRIGPEKREARATAFGSARRRSGPAAREIPAPRTGNPRAPGVRRYNPETGRIE